MGSTNKTTSLSLPQWVGSDKPTFLGDMNDAFLKIDNSYTDLSGDVATATSESGQALKLATDAHSSVRTLAPKISVLETNVNSATTTANNASSTANTALSSANTNATAIKNLNSEISQTITGSFTNKNSNIDEWMGGFVSYKPKLGQLYISLRVHFDSSTTNRVNVNLATISGINLPNTTTRTIYGGMVFRRYNKNATPTIQADMAEFSIDPNGKIILLPNEDLEDWTLTVVAIQVCLNTSNWS